jgi:hypothetical protein
LAIIAAAEVCHFLCDFRREITALQSVPDAILRFPERRTCPIEIRPLQFVLEEVRAFRLIAACRRYRVPQVAGEPEVLRRSAVLRVLDDQLPQLVGQLPANQLFM